MEGGNRRLGEPNRLLQTEGGEIEIGEGTKTVEDDDAITSCRHSMLMSSNLVSRSPITLVGTDSRVCSGTGVGVR